MRELKKLINNIGVVIVITLVVGILKAYLGFDVLHWKVGEFKDRLDGFTDYMRYGYASAFLFILSIAMYLNKEKTENIISPKFLMICLILCFAAVFTAKTRGALRAILAGIPILILKYKPNIAATIIESELIFVSIVMYISFSGKKTDSRFFNLNDGSNRQRISQFYNAIKSTQEKPVFGLGISQFTYNVSRIKHKYDICSKNMWDRHIF